MDTAAYLKKQGWRGAGHSLDSSDRGIVRPLQISKKIDVLGVGIQKYAAVSDQWWLRAYDQGLKDLGSGKESALATAQKHGVNRGGLYARFVKGKEIPGTIGQRLVTDVISCDASERKKKKSVNNVSMEVKSLKRNACEESTRPRKKHAAQSASIHSLPENENIRLKIRAYVVEATKRGILPVGPAEINARKTTITPSDQDMDAVLRLAKMHKRYDRKGDAPQLVEREKLMRNLKRAALKYLESRIQAAPA